jgi:acyl carrier protein
MDNMEVYRNAFIEAFGIEDDVVAELKYQDIEEWDSVGHMTLMAMIEDAFDIMMDTDDIIDFGSFKNGIEILAKYDVVI